MTTNKAHSLQVVANQKEPGNKPVRNPQWPSTNHKEHENKVFKTSTDDIIFLKKLFSDMGLSDLDLFQAAVTFFKGNMFVMKLHFNMRADTHYDVLSRFGL